jgi:hypothetical protein
MRSLNELERIAFPERDHPYSLTELREFAYLKKSGQRVESELATHIDSCEYCNRELAILEQTDPVLTGEEAKRVKVIIEAVTDPSTQEKIDSKARKTLAAAVGSRGRAVGSAAAAFVTTLLRSQR